MPNTSYTHTAANTRAGSNTIHHRSVYETEILPRIRFAEQVAVRTALRLDGIEPDDALLAIAKTLAAAELHGRSL
jgi:hypothetical protein